MSPRRIVLGSSAGVRNGVLPSRGSRRRAASVVGSGFGRGVGSSMFDCTAVFLSAALFEDCVRGVDMGCHQGGIGPVRDVRVQLCHVVLESVSGPGAARRADEYERAVAWSRSLIRRCRGRANYGGWSPYSLGLCCRIRHTVSPSVHGPGVDSRRRGVRGIRSRCPRGEAYPVRVRVPGVLPSRTCVAGPRQLWAQGLGSVSFSTLRASPWSFGARRFSRIAFAELMLGATRAGLAPFVMRAWSVAT